MPIFQAIRGGGGLCQKNAVLTPNDIRALFVLIGNTFLGGQSEETENKIASFKQLFPHVRSSDLRQAYRVRKPEHMELVERTIARIGLPE